MDFDWRQRRTIRILSFILVVLVVAVLIVGGYRWRQLRQVQQSMPGGEDAAMASTQHEYTALSYKYNNRTLSFAVNETTDRWQWTDDPDFPLDGSVVEEICSMVANLKPQQTLAAEESMESYGFTDPVATLTAASGEETLSLTFGRATTDGASRYAQINGDEATVYIFDAAVLEKLNVPIYDMAILPELPALTAQTLDSLTINGTVGTILSAQRSEGEESATWRSGGANVTDLPQVQALLADLEQLTLVKCVDFKPSDEAAEICGFAEPVVLRADYHNGGAEQSFVLRVGAATLDGVGRYVRLDDGDTIYQVAADQLDTLLQLAETGLEG